jgi:hypothetical protein
MGKSFKERDLLLLDGKDDSGESSWFLKSFL